MKFLNELLNEHKSDRRGVNIGEDFKVHKVGYNRNGLWCYWVSYMDGRAKAIQVNGNIEGNRITDIRDFNKPETDDIKDGIKEYYRRYLM